MKVGKIDDKTSYQKRKEIVNNYKTGEIKIIFNFGVLSTGFDAPEQLFLLLDQLHLLFYILK